MDRSTDMAKLDLGHVVGRSTKHRINSTTTVTQWALYPLGGVRRPADGTYVTSVYCRRCGRAVRLSVDSETVVLKKRRTWGIWGWSLTCPALVMILIAFVVGFGTAAGGSLIGGGAFVLLTGLAFGAAASDTGARIAKGEPRASRKIHEIRRSLR